MAYNNVIASTYWTSAEVTWDGVKWSCGTVSEFSMAPTSALHPSTWPIEIRFHIVLNAGKELKLYDAAAGTPVQTIRLAGVIGQIVVVRTPSGSFTSWRFHFDSPSAVEITEIESLYT